MTRGEREGERERERRGDRRMRKEREGGGGEAMKRDKRMTGKRKESPWPKMPKEDFVYTQIYVARGEREREREREREGKSQRDAHVFIFSEKTEEMIPSEFMLPLSHVCYCGKYYHYE
jgi:hypothetical protein